MRGRADDADVWGDLYERFRRPGAPRRARAGSALPPEARGRLIDAALGVLGSVRTLIDVAEEVLEDRRERLGHEPGPGPWVRSPEGHARRPAPDEEEGGVVRDIPFSDS